MEADVARSKEKGPVITFLPLFVLKSYLEGRGQGCGVGMAKLQFVCLLGVLLLRSVPRQAPTSLQHVSRRQHVSPLPH